MQEALVKHRTPVVVAEDNQLQRLYASKILENLGYEALQAANGHEALDLLRETGAQILVCDLDMPGMDGHELVQRVRADMNGASDHYVHIIMVTGKDQKRDRDLALDAGVDDFMGKPLEPATLTARIRSTERLLTHEKLLAERTRILAEANARIEQDLRTAARAQKRLLPEKHIRIDDLNFHSEFVPSNIFSGDMFGFFKPTDNHVAFYSVDVAGHGLQASFLSVALGHLLTPAYFQKNAFDADGNPDLAALASRLNARFYMQDDAEYFTMFCGVIERGSDVLHFCQAGAPSPWLIDPDGSVRLVGDGGFPVALVQDAIFENSSVPFPPGASLVTCSDGAPEAENTKGQPFGNHGVEAALAACPDDPARIPQTIVKALGSWCNARPLDDDLTILVCERTSET